MCVVVEYCLFVDFVFNVDCDFECFVVFGCDVDCFVGYGVDLGFFIWCEVGVFMYLFLFGFEI